MLRGAEETLLLLARGDGVNGVKTCRTYGNAACLSITSDTGGPQPTEVNTAFTR